MELPEQLRINRKRLGLSQEDVAHAIFVSRQTMSSWENSKSYPDVQSLLLLSQLFGVSIDELVKGDVVSMKEMVSKDAVIMERLSWASIILLVMGFASMIGFCAVWEDPSPIPHLSCGFLAGMGLFLALFAWAMVLSARIEHIKKNHNLVTYREISAFMEGEDAREEDDALSRKHPFIANTLKLVCGAGIGFFVSFIIVLIVNILN